MTIDELRSCTRKELGVIARRHQIPGWHPMRKEELIKAIASVTRSKRSPSKRNGRRAAGLSARKQRNGTRNTRSHAANVPSRRFDSRLAAMPPLVRLSAANGKPINRDLSTSSVNESGRDLLQVEVRDLNWICLDWEISKQMVQRAETALGSEWHRATCVIRVIDTNESEAEVSANICVRDYEINGDVSVWYLQVDNPNCTYQFQIGYLAPSGRIFVLAKSRKVCTSQDPAGRTSRSATALPTAASTGSNIYRQLLNGSITLETGEERVNTRPPFPFQLDVELSISGATHPDADVTILGAQVEVGRDGAFHLKLGLPNGRQLFPAVAITPDGREQRTIVLSIERNTKELEPLLFGKE